MPATVTTFDPLLTEADAAAMLCLCEDFGDYGTYVVEQSRQSFAPTLSQRHDAAANFVRTGGRFGRREPIGALAARTNYFRESYAYGDRIVAAGIEPFLHHEGFRDAAAALYDRPVVVPAIVYANLLLPGQELAVHTDVPEFRGANRTLYPQWLMVVMHHSGLFDSWRMPIATGIAYFGEAAGGALAHYPDGPDGPAVVHPARHNSAVLLDTDSVFHGVDRVGDTSLPAAPVTATSVLRWRDHRWELRDGGETVASYAAEEVRFSVSWKACCFADEAERAAWADHADDLTLEVILGRLADDLRDRGVLERGAALPHDDALGRLLIDTYIRFPAPAVAGI